MSERRYRPTEIEMLAYRIQQLEEERKSMEGAIRILGERIDKLTLAVVGFTLTLAVFGLGIAVTLLTASQ